MTDPTPDPLTPEALATVGLREAATEQVGRLHLDDFRAAIPAALGWDDVRPATRRTIRNQVRPTVDRTLDLAADRIEATFGTLGPADIGAVLRILRG